jgi:uncharacterized membrane protein
MVGRTAGWQGLHRFLVRESFYLLVLWSAMACGIVLGRLYLSQSWTYLFLVWNLFLAWVPYGLSLWIAASRERTGGRVRWWWVPVGVVWLLFFPNAPYLLTDLVHLQKVRPFPLWYDLALLLSFAWAGCFLAVASLRTMQLVVRDVVGWAGSWLFVIVVAGLSGLGIYLGRFLDWNSWDIVTQPRAVLGDVLVRVILPWTDWRAVGFSVLFAVLLLGCYVTLVNQRGAVEEW